LPDWRTSRQINADRLALTTSLHQNDTPMPLIQWTKAFLKNTLKLDRAKVYKFQSLRFRALQHCIYRPLIGSNLKALATVYHSDKWGTHWYSQHYEKHFAGLRRKRLNVLEIGIGGYDDPELGGGSLRMWRTYFPKGRIFGIDIYDKSRHQERRIKTLQGSQVDEAFLHEVVKSIGKLDIVIDDGSHENEHVIRTFELLFPRMAENGFYVIEDTQTSYWKSCGGSSEVQGGARTSMEFFKRLIDGLNHQEFELADYHPTYYDRHIVSIHFYHNIIFIQKGLNDEKSNRWKPFASEDGEPQNHVECLDARLEAPT
jgi:hypothetical protein